MRTIEKIKEVLNQRNLKLIAAKTGLHYNTIYNIANGKNKNPTFETIERIKEALKDGNI